MVLAPLGWSYAAGAGNPVYDAQLELHVIPKLTEINTNLDGILKAAEEQLEMAKDDTKSLDDIKKATQDTVERLDSLLKAIGKPEDVPMETGDLVDRLNDALNDGLKKDRPPVDDKDKSIFRETGDGIIKAVGEQFEYQPPVTGKKDEPKGKKTGDRVLQDYVGESEQIKAVNEYYRVRDKAVARREQLVEVLRDVLEDMQDNSKDFAHLAKQTALVEIIQGQIQMSSNDINNAFNDVAVKGVQVYTLNSVKSKADAEPKLAEVNANVKAAQDMSDAIASGTISPGMPPNEADDTEVSSGGGFLPWPDRKAKTP
jgi:hypothetical protein